MNAGFAYSEQIGRDGEGRTVLAHLSLRYRHSTASAWRERLEAGEVRLGGSPARADDRLRAGQTLVWNRPPWEEPPVPLAFAVVHLDAHLLAVGKPRGLPSLPNGGFLTHTLLHLVRRRWPEATPMHRLGRGTSGLLLFTRTEEARRAVAAAWRDGGIEKEYRALLRGAPDREAFTVDAAIGRVPHPRLGHVWAASTGGKAAVSHIRVRAIRGANAVADVRIDTGRPHQIRIHAAAAGFPLVGDPLYGPGGVPVEDPALPGEGGYRLHAYRLSLVHPVGGRRLQLECAPPPELRFPS